MKKIIISLCLSICLTALSAVAQKEQKINSKIERITVFTNNAQIERIASLNLQAGSNTIVISGLSQYLDANSVRISGKGAFVIMSHQVHLKYPEPEKINEETMPAHIIKGIDNLMDSLEILSFDIAENTSKRDVLNAEKNFLNTSQAISKTDTITELKDALAYYRMRMNDINQELIKVQKTERILLKKKIEIEKRLTALRNYSTGVKPEKKMALPESVLSIEIYAEKAVSNAVIDFSYAASQVSWTPFYELKVEDITKPVQLVMKANLTQNTGEDWEKARLVFSTGKPSIYKVLPILPVWYLSYYYNEVASKTTGMAAPKAVSDYSKEERDDEVMAESMAYYTQINQSLIAAEYVVSIPYSIASDGKNHSITLLSEPLGASYKFYAIPKMDKDVFLTAYLTGWEKLNLLPGTANIVYQNSIISKTYINANNTTDTILVSLGVDKRIVVDRKKISDKSKDKIIGSSRERTVHFEITIKNQSQSEILFVLKDQVPVSGNEDIKVSVESISGGKLNELTGEIEWQMKLKANEIKKLELRYIVKHDKSKNVVCE